jgi:hypothetical protein
MSIYRGAGGAGDAVADSSSEALLVQQLATEAQADADAAAASATAAAGSASAASTSATNAANSAASIDVTLFTQKANNLSDLVSTSTARTNLGVAIGTNVQAWDADLDTWATKTAPSGTVVGTSDTQTLTTKTIALGSNTVSGTLAQFNTAVTDADLVSIAGTETLTNKTLTSPVVTGGSINNTPIGATTASTGAFSTLSATGVTTVQAGTVSAPAITTTGDTNTGIFFPAADTIAFTEGGAEVARFDSNGRLGIGTSSPTQQLEVAATSSATATILAQNTTATNGGAQLRAGNPQNLLIMGTDSNGGGLTGTANSSFLYTTSTSPIVFMPNATERMRINSSGTVLVGNTSDSNLPGNGSSNASGLGIFSDGRFCLGRSEYPMQMGVNSSGSSKIAIQFLQNGTSVGLITVSNNTSTAYTSGSDYRLKEDILPMTGALAKVAQLKPVTYKWKINGLDGQGFIAHELAEIVPDAVSGEKDAVDEDGKPKYQGVDTSFLVATLTAAIQEQQAMITSLTERIVALEGAAV